MTVQLNKFQIIALTSIIVLGVYGATEYLSQKRTVALQTEIEKKIEDQKATIVTLSETTARNGADAVAENTVRDCNVDERKEFDTLLGRLDEGLPQAELQKLDRLFGRCGYFFAQRKSIMVARLNREVAVYENYINQLEALTGTSKKDDYAVETWKTLATDEEKQSVLFMDLVRTQDDIITTLLSGKTANSNEIQTILNEVKEIQETLSVTSMQTADVRAELISK